MKIVIKPLKFLMDIVHPFNWSGLTLSENLRYIKMSALYHSQLLRQFVYRYDNQNISYIIELRELRDYIVPLL